MQDIKLLSQLRLESLHNNSVSVLYLIFTFCKAIVQMSKSVIEVSTFICYYAIKAVRNLLRTLTLYQYQAIICTMCVCVCVCIYNGSLHCFK